MPVIQQQWDIIKYAMKKRSGKFTEKNTRLYEDIYFEQKERFIAGDGINW